MPGFVQRCLSIVTSAWLVGQAPLASAQADRRLPGDTGLTVARQAGEAQVPRAFSDLRASVESLGALVFQGRARELTVRWQAYPGDARDVVTPAAAVAVNVFDVIGERSLPAGSAVRERSPELSEDQLVIVAIDDTGQPIAWQAIRDPRVLRSETRTVSGELVGQVFHRAQVDLIVTVPLSVSVAALEVYDPRWSDTGWQLERLGSVAIPSR